jgi:hypothetical protein
MGKKGGRKLDEPLNSDRNEDNIESIEGRFDSSNAKPDNTKSCNFAHLVGQLLLDK